MSRSVRSIARLVATGCVLAGATVFAASPASAAQRWETFDLPSAQGNIDLTEVKLNKVTDLRAAVLLPDGYDENPSKDWPVLYLIAGIGDNYTGWDTSGQIRTVGKDFPGIIVMPETGRGFLMDWWKGGTRKGQNWSSYILDEVIPVIHQRYRVKPGRQFHAIGGISMGAYGALLLGGQFPSYFGTILSLSALADSQNLEAYGVLPGQAGAGSYEQIWGPVLGPYATVNNPLRNVENVKFSRIYLHTGNGFPDPFVPFNADAWTKGVAIEGFALKQNINYDLLLTQGGVQHVFKIKGGVHDWPYWRREFPIAVKWGLFNKPLYSNLADATKWSYRTMASSGNAWGIGFSFAKAPTGSITLQRSGNTFVAAGSGTITVNPGAAEWDFSGAGTKPQCSFTATLPVTKTLPAGCF